MKKLDMGGLCAFMGIFVLIASFFVFLISGFKKKNMVKPSLMLLTAASLFIIENTEDDKE